MDRVKYLDLYYSQRPGANPFPTKFSALPGIGGQDSPTPNADNQIMPYGGNRDRNGYGGARTSTEGLEPEERIRQIETRVVVAEKSNRALLEEVVRLQSELKTQTRSHNDNMQEEKQSRIQLENSLRASNDLILQLSQRLQRAEDKVLEEKATISTLLNHTKNVEQTVMGNQQELSSRKDQQNSKLLEMQNQLNETGRSKDQLERMVFSLVEELRQVKAKTDSHTMDLQSVVGELRTKSHKLEEDSRQALDSMRKQGETQSQTDYTTSQLRNQIESRLGELRDVVLELRGKQEKESQDRRILEQQLALRLGDTNASLAEQNRRREEAIHALDAVQREREHAAETERLRLQSKIAEIAEEVSKKILQKEMRLREENQSKYAKLEKMLSEEQEARQKHERDMREENEQRWDSLRKLQDEEVSNIRDIQKSEKKKVNETMRKLNEAVNILDKQNEGQKKQQDKVLSAEIKSRKQHEMDTIYRIDGVQEKLSVAMATLQQAIGGMKAQLSTQQEKIRHEVRGMLDNQQQAGTRSLTDMDARIVSLNTQVNQMDEKLAAKIAIIAILEEKMAQIEKELGGRVKTEADERNREVKELRDEIEAGNNKSVASKQDVEGLQQSIRKLAESIQTVKTVLGMKIQSEQKLRVEEISNIQEDLVKIQELVEPLLDTKPTPKLFVKPENVGRITAEKQAPAINKWSMYTAYRWLIWKQKLTSLFQDGSSTEGSSDEEESSDSTSKKTSKKSSDSDSSDSDDDSDDTKKPKSRGKGKKKHNDADSEGGDEDSDDTRKKRKSKKKPRKDADSDSDSD